MENLFYFESDVLKIGSIVIQFGTDRIPENGIGEGTFNFKKPFPNSCISIVGTDVGAGTRVLGINHISNSQFKAWGKNGTSPAGSLFHWIAIGY